MMKIKNLFGAIMRSITVNGGAPLYGEVKLSGSKNAALPILFATILTEGVSRIRNLPDIGDVRITLEILRGLGARVSQIGDETVIDTAELKYSHPRESDVCRIRASTYLIGACLSRFGICALPQFGGCNFSERPIDLHIAAARALGAEFDGKTLSADSLSGGEIDFPKPSVGATVNAILLAVCAKGRSVIRGFACEPHIDALIDFLLSAGADIKRTEREIIIYGRKLHGGNIEIPGDMIEAGTYLALGTLTGGEVWVRGCPKEHLVAVISSLSSFGAKISASSDGVSARQGSGMRYSEIIAAPHPGFPTDLQPIFAVVAAHFWGGRITDTVWQSRFGYLSELKKFGVSSKNEVGCAEIFPSKLHSARAKAPDLRGGMACVVAALVAKGESVIESAQTVERGYEALAEKLSSIGADVKISDQQ